MRDGLQLDLSSLSTGISSMIIYKQTVSQTDSSLLPASSLVRLNNRNETDVRAIYIFVLGLVSRIGLDGVLDWI